MTHSTRIAAGAILGSGPRRSEAGRRGSSRWCWGWRRSSGRRTEHHRSGDPKHGLALGGSGRTTGSSGRRDWCWRLKVRNRIARRSGGRRCRCRGRRSRTRRILEAHHGLLRDRLGRRRGRSWSGIVGFAALPAEANASLTRGATVLADARRIGHGSQSLANPLAVFASNFSVESPTRRPCRNALVAGPQPTWPRRSRHERRFPGYGRGG